jgi:cobaltochelatase CobN
MHLLLRETHGLEETAQAEDLGQAPADLVVLSFGDGDLSAFAAGWRAWGDGAPSLRLANLKRLAHPLSVDLYVEKTLSGARGVLIRLLGGLDYWRYGVEQTAQIARERRIALAIVPGDRADDARLEAASNVPRSTLKRLRALCDAGGAEAARAALGQLALAAGLSAPPPREAATGLAPHGFYRPREGQVCALEAALRSRDRPRVALVFYRSVLAAADTAAIDALADALEARGADPVALFAPSLKDPQSDGWLRRWLAALAPDAILNATAFSARAEGGGAGPLGATDAPVIQVALAGSSRAAWAGSARGLGPSDLAMHVVLPEIDGRVFAGAVSFKHEEPADPALGFARKVHAPEPEGVAHAAELALAWARLARMPRAERRLALVLSSYPGRADQLAHAVGLDAPQSAVETLGLLAREGFAVADAPTTSADLISRLAAARIRWPLDAYRDAAARRLAPEMLAAVDAAWGPPQADPQAEGDAFAFAAFACDRALVAAQPERGAAVDRARQYHDPRLPPRHAYVAFHLWLREVRRIDALVHMGAHGTLEWLPGKAAALAPSCWPRALIGPTPVVYPFVVNDPGEAAAAKRRIAAVTLGHLTPPLRRAAVPDHLAPLERLLDAYATADGLDPRRRDRLAREIVAAARATGLAEDAGVAHDTPAEDALVRLDALVCDVKDAMFADGLHVYGRAPEATGDMDPALAAACAAKERASLLAALDGRAVAPGPAGSPWRGRADVAPTGRNLFAVDPRAVPSRDAAAEGARLADALIARHLQDHGEHPRAVVVDLWASTAMRTGGEDVAMAFALAGVRPTWEHGSDRVTGFEIAPLAMLGRPRVDVTLRVSGLFRDLFETLPAMFEQAFAALAARDEPPDENPYRVRAAAGPRVFGPAPSAYGLDVVERLDALTPASLAAAGEAWLDGACHAYGGGRDGAPARAALDARTRAADAFVHMQDLPETDILAAPDYAAAEGGFAAARRVLGAGPAALYHADATRPGTKRVRTLAEEAARVVLGRATRPQWIEGQMRHGFRGAAEIAWTLEQMAAFAHLAQAVTSRHVDLYFDATLGDAAVRAFLEAANPAAADAMRRRFRQLLDAGLWRTRRNSVHATLGAPASEAAA